jgi:hypothetical protein
MRILSALNSSVAFVALAVSALTLSPTCSAQYKLTRMTVDIPFSFDTSLQHFEPGVYTLSVSDSNIVRFSNRANSGLSMTLPDIDNRVSANNKVVFRKYGTNRYFLREIWIAGKAEHFHTLLSKKEKQVEVAVNKAGMKGSEVALLEMPK